jgi:hypothetical protein
LNAASKDAKRIPVGWDGSALIEYLGSSVVS